MVDLKKIENAVRESCRQSGKSWEDHFQSVGDGGYRCILFPEVALTWTDHNYLSYRLRPKIPETTRKRNAVRARATGGL